MDCGRSNYFCITSTSRKRNLRRRHFALADPRRIGRESLGVGFRFSGECECALAQAARMIFEATLNFTAGKDRQSQSAFTDRKRSAAEILRRSERHSRVTATRHEHASRYAEARNVEPQHRQTQRSVPTPQAPAKSATSCPRAPVSVGLRTIETGDNILAQRQSPRASRRLCVDAKVPKSASTAATSRTMSPPASDPRSMQRRSSRDVM